MKMSVDWTTVYFAQEITMDKMQIFKAYETFVAADDSYTFV